MRISTICGTSPPVRRQNQVTRRINHLQESIYPARGWLTHPAERGVNLPVYLRVSFAEMIENTNERLIDYRQV
jgi:hypothetical protein